MHLLVILLQQLLGLIPNKQQAQPEPVRVRTAPPNGRREGAPEQQAFQSSYGAESLRAGMTEFSESTASTRPSRAVLRALGGDCGRAGFNRTDVTTVEGTLPAGQSRSPASLDAASPELRA